MLFFDRLAMFSPYLKLNQSQPATILTYSDVLHRRPSCLHLPVPALPRGPGGAGTGGSRQRAREDAKNAEGI